MTIEKYGRYWKVVDAAGALICMTVYKCGALEVVRRLQALDGAQRWQDTNSPAAELDAPAVASDLF
jgi:hypothetical protein